MAVKLYTNGLTEEYRPKKLVFSEEELLDIFKDFDNIKTKRILPIINTWIIYGDDKNLDNYNRIASVITKDSIFTDVLFIHDSEIDPTWNMTDDIIYKSYDEFYVIIEKLITDVAEAILAELEEKDELYGSIDSLPQFSELGVTSDKKLLFGFNPNMQTTQFYKQGFQHFSEKVYKYLSDNKQNKEPFKIYEDNKAIIIIETPNVKSFLLSLLNTFKENEEYEICKDISNMISDWNKKTNKETKINNKNKEKNNLSDNKSNE